MTVDPKACERLAAQLREFRKQGLYCDVVLLAAGTRYAAHRAVLAAQGLLQPGDMTSELRIVGISKKTLVALLDRLYGETSPSPMSGDVNPFCDVLGLGGDSGVGAVHLAQRLHEMREITGDLQLCGTTGHSVHAHRVVLAAGCEVLSEFLSSTAEASGDTYELTLQSISDIAALQAAVDTVYLGTPMSSCGEDAELLCSSWQLPQPSRSPPGSQVESKCVTPLVPAAKRLKPSKCTLGITEAMTEPKQPPKKRGKGEVSIPLEEITSGPFADASAALHALLRGAGHMSMASIPRSVRGGA